MKLSPVVVHYTPVALNRREACRYCRHFQPPAACRLVAGRIAPGGWCDRFEAVMTRGRHPHGFARAGGRAAAAALRTQRPTVSEAVATARQRGIQVEWPVSGPEYERAIVALHAAGIAHNMDDEPYTQRILAGYGDYVRENPRGRRDPRAMRLIFGDVAQWTVAANISQGDRIAFLNYAGRGREGPEYQERTGTVHLVGPEGPVVSLPGDRYGARPVVVTQDKFLRVVSRKRNPPEEQEEEEPGTLADFIRRHHVTSTATEDPSIPEDPAWRGASHWKVQVRVEGRVMTIPYHLGSAHTGPPQLDDVLNSLALDSSGYENARGFEDWASEYGYDADSRKARGIWRQVQVQARKLKQLLGATAYDELLYHTESL